MRSANSLVLCILTAFLFLVSWTGEAGAITVDFDSLAHGEKASGQFRADYGLTISAENRGGGPDLAIIFNSTLTGTRDPDLEDAWSGGNIASETLNNLLIIAENGRDSNHDGLIDHPDDEGSSPAGSIFFDFDNPITSFGFDMIDIEGPDEFGKDSGFFAVFYDGDTVLASVGFSDLIDPTSPFFDPTIAYGNNTANRIQPIMAAQLDLDRFDRVEINLGGSGAVDNISFDPAPVPEPSTVCLVGLGLLGLARFSKKKSPKTSEIS